MKPAADLYFSLLHVATHMKLNNFDGQSFSGETFVYSHEIIIVV